VSLRKRLRPRLLFVYALAAVGLAFARPSLASLIAGGALIALGEGLRLWATGHLHKNDALTVTGAYAFVRHPLYLGTLLIGCGFLIMAQTWVALALGVAFGAFYFGYYLPYKDRIESARLEARYGDEFRRYAAAVPRLIPRLRPYVPLGGVGEPQAGWRSVRFADNHETGTAVAVAVGMVVMALRWGLG
jgi:protein-S-isoprenylcysteine O-methyltransferase Ste14